MLKHLRRGGETVIVQLHFCKYWALPTRMVRYVCGWCCEKVPSIFKMAMVKSFFGSERTFAELSSKACPPRMSLMSTLSYLFAFNACWFSIPETLIFCDFGAIAASTFNPQLTLSLPELLAFKFAATFHALGNWMWNSIYTYDFDGAFVRQIVIFAFA